MGREEMEIGFSIIKDPIFTSLPIIHETCQHHWLVLFHIPLHKLTVIQFFPIHLLYLTSNSDSHFFSSLSLKVTKVVNLWDFDMGFVFCREKQLQRNFEKRKLHTLTFGFGLFHFSPYLGIFLLHQIWFWFKMVIRLL